MSLTPKEITEEFLSSGSGKAGAVLFLVLIGISVFVVVTYPLDFGVRVWSNPAIWADNPKAAPPSWVNSFTSTKLTEHRILEATVPTQVADGAETRTLNYNFAIDYQSDQFPTFLSFSIGRVDYYRDPPLVSVSIVRPDGNEVMIYRELIAGPRQNEIPPISRHVDAPLRINMGGDSSVVSNLAKFLREDLGIEISLRNVAGNVEKILFGSLSDRSIGDMKVLNGNYQIKVRFATYDRQDSIERVRFVIGGSVFGFMGTDSLGRDLAVGLLFGFPVALAIGLSTAILTTMIGSFMGIISGYIGGKTDTAIQRSSDVLSNIPLLPILIFLIFILGQKLWLVIAILIAFGWPGLTIIVRSMVLQIRSGQSVEAAKALGASRPRIMARHIFPQIAPFIFAQMIFFTPAAILAEAALSFLGLGDPSIPTWGQILENGFRTGGVYVGFWWWILPPGLLIVFTAMIFVFIALGLEPVVNPRLKRMI